MIKGHLQVNLSVTMSLEESLQLERALAGFNNEQVKALVEALRIQNAVANRLVMNGSATVAAA